MCASRQTTCRGRVQCSGVMTELLQQIDPDCYRSAQLRLVRGELERIRQEQSAVTGAAMPCEGTAEVAAGQDAPEGGC